MTTPTLIVAANGYTRDHVTVALNGKKPWQEMVGCLIPWDPVEELWLTNGTVRFVTDNNLDDGVFQVVGQE